MGMALVCITGSTDGIGLAAARQLLEDGHEVLVHARSAERGECLPDLRVGAVDPGWVKTKLAAAGAPGDVRSGGARVATAAADPAWPGGYPAGSRPARLPDALTSTRLQDELLAAMDRLAGAHR